MTPLASAVNRFRYRVGFNAVFDADDARQEASIRAWLTSDDRQCVAYGAIFDAFKAMHHGWVTRRHLRFEDADHEECVHVDSPEEILIAQQALNSMRERATLHGVDVIAALAEGEHPAQIAERADVSHSRVKQVIAEARR